MKRDLKGQFNAFTKQSILEVVSYHISPKEGDFYGNSFDVCLGGDSNISVVYRTIPKFSDTHQFYTFDIKKATLSDYFWDISKPSTEELEMFAIEFGSEMCDNIFSENKTGFPI